MCYIITHKTGTDFKSGEKYMERRTVTIRNKAGIHCRPSSAIMTVAAKFSGHEFTAESKRGKVCLNSILDLLSMGLQKGDEVTIEVQGPNEKEACEKLAELFATEFDFV